eukprot:4376574-Lingulodinium_polyedra.AAC.1
MLARRPLRRVFFDVTHQIALSAATAILRAWALHAWRPPRLARVGPAELRARSEAYLGAFIFTAHRARLVLQRAYASHLFE